MIPCSICHSPDHHTHHHYARTARGERFENRASIEVVERADRERADRDTELPPEPVPDNVVRLVPMAKDADPNSMANRTRDFLKQLEAEPAKYRGLMIVAFLEGDRNGAQVIAAFPNSITSIEVSGMCQLISTRVLNGSLK